MARISAHFENSEPFLEKILSDLRFGKIAKHIPQNSRVLDLGCGYDGKLLKKIKSRISAGFGVDISVNPDHQDDKIFLVEHDLSRPLPFQNDEFDAIASLANLEHLRDPEHALKEIHRVLKPGGVLLLTAPSIYAKPVLETLAFLRIVSREEIRDHKNYFNKNILTDLCKKTGFSSVSHRYFQCVMNNFVIAKK